MTIKIKKIPCCIVALLLGFGSIAVADELFAHQQKLISTLAVKQLPHINAVNLYVIYANK